ncbi:MAG: SDR family oxidoreductase [Prevotella sp.]|nr:SDR family oxidoreductase [Prevotella sp.]
MKTIILTGGSSGIGKAAAELFSRKNYEVYEFSRHGENRDGISHVDCDVTNPDMCRKAVELVLARSGKIDLLVCNAGMGISGAIEFTKLEDAKRQFEVNFFGALNITQAVLPYMRERRQGRIIFTSSVAAVYAIPFQAFYSASKAALNSMALALANEVRPFGISVASVLPGDVKTNFQRKKIVEGADIYTHMNKAVEQMEHDEENGMSAEQIARCIYRTATADRPWAFNTTGIMYHLFLFAGRLFPTSFINRVLGKMY